MVQELTPRQRGLLLDIARQAIQAALEGRSPPSVGEVSQEEPALKRPAGAFVTLKWRGALRGCIGHVPPDKPLAQVVRDMAVAAAFYDPRFPPLQPEELPETEIEISILTPLERVKDINEIEVGRDGLVVRSGERSGLLLPQVATEHGWDRETFLEHTCIKAGLPPDAWRRGVEIWKFQSEVFGGPFFPPSGSP